MKYLKLIFPALISLLLMSGCASVDKPRLPVSKMDNVTYHNSTGLKKIQSNNFKTALKEFRLARELNPDSALSYVGSGLCFSHLKDFKAAESALNSGLDKSQSGYEKGMAHAGMIYYHMNKKGKDWFDNCEDNFHKSLSESKDLPWAYYYMGLASKEAFQYRKAEDYFKKVVAIDKIFVKEADNALKKIQKIVRAMPGTKVGKKLALEPQITRGDVCAVFVHELNLERTFKKFHKNKSEIKNTPEDIKNHPLKTDILTILKYNIRGLGLDHNNRFYPDRAVKRAEFAMILEDIISLLSQQKNLGRSFIGCRSPFPDVEASYAFFNSLITVTSRGLMSSEDILTGKFNPNGYVSGSDALIIIRKFREKIKF